MFESDGVVTLVVSVMDGDIRTSITVALSTTNASAIGKVTVPMVFRMQDWIRLTLSRIKYNYLC